MEAMFPGGRRTSISNDEINGDTVTEQVNCSATLGGSDGNRTYDTDTVISNSSVNVDGKSNDNKYIGKYDSSSPLMIFLRNIKKITQIGSNQSNMKNKDYKSRSKSLGRSKSLKRETPSLTLPVTFGKQVCFDGDKVPGVVGIKNHGNTCYMNSVLQCLSNTELLTQYFITDQYKQDIRGKSKQNAKKYGTKGELTTHLARLLKSLWTQHYSPTISSDFKASVGKYGPQYRGNLQHDAQEFLLWFLDKIHEDLNIAAKKRYRHKSVSGRSDEMAAAEALANHTRMNNSYIHDLFQAQYKSSLTCPNCHQQSNTFDPFLCVSLPIPQRNTKPLYVTVVYLDAHPKQVRIGLLLEPSDTVKQLREALACDTNIPQEQLILTEIYYDGFHRTFHNSQPLCELREADNIYAIEVPASEMQQTEGHTPVKTTKTEKSEPERANSEEKEIEARITLVLLNKPNGPNARRFGGPFVLSVCREISQLSLQQQILNSMAPMLNEDCLEQIKELKELLFRLKVLEELEPKGVKTLLPERVEMPLFMPEIDRALQACTPGGGPEHVKLIVEWEEETKHRIIANTAEQVEEHSSVKQVKQQNHKPLTATLDECLTTYTKEERLECDTAWYCPNCKSQQHGTTKSISLWSLPDIFIIHLKRFKQTSINRSKLETLITFPLTSLDMSKHVARRPWLSSLSNGVNNNKESGWSPWRPNRKPPMAEVDYIYDLYGVVNHKGNMQGGHYTAYCKSAATSKWYSFDDTKVTDMKENDVITPSAYLLFYQRRSANSCTVYHPDHWLHKVARIRFIDPAPTRHSQSQEDLLDEDKHSSDFVRSSNPYATMRTPHHKTKADPTTKDSFSVIVGSPSMGSLGHVQMSADPMRVVRADSETSGNHPADSPSLRDVKCPRNSPRSQDVNYQSNSPSLRDERGYVDLYLDQKYLQHQKMKQESAITSKPNIRPLSRSKSETNESVLSQNQNSNCEVKTGILIDLDVSTQDLKTQNESQDDQSNSVTSRRRRKSNQNGQQPLSTNKSPLQQLHNQRSVDISNPSLHQAFEHSNQVSNMTDYSTPSGYHPAYFPQNGQMHRTRHDSKSSYRSTYTDSSYRSRNNSQSDILAVEYGQLESSHNSGGLRDLLQKSSPTRSRKTSQNGGVFSPQMMRSDRNLLPSHPQQFDGNGYGYENFSRMHMEGDGRPFRHQYSDEQPKSMPVYGSSPLAPPRFIGYPNQPITEHNRYLHQSGPLSHRNVPVSGNTSNSGSASGSSYDNVSVENNLNEQKLAALMLSNNRSLQGTPKTSRVKRPQNHVSSVPKEIRSREDRIQDPPYRTEKRETPEKELQKHDYNKKAVFLQESCV